MSDRRIPPQGGPHHAEKLRELAELEEIYAHELLDPDERLELRERIIRLRRHLNPAG